MKKMKNALLLAMVMLAVVSCSKDEEGTSSSKSDADKMTGTYTVTEYEKTFKRTVDYTVEVSKVNDSTIKITDIDYTLPADADHNYHWKGDIVANLAKKYLILKGSTVSGEITDEKNWTINYSYGAGATYYKVTQTYKRK